MSGKSRPVTNPAREKLLYLIVLRQFETPCQAMRDAYERLASAASVSTGWDVRTVILDWLEAEMRSLSKLDNVDDTLGPRLMTAAVSLAKAVT